MDDDEEEMEDEDEDKDDEKKRKENVNKQGKSSECLLVFERHVGSFNIIVI